MHVCGNCIKTFIFLAQAPDKQVRVLIIVELNQMFASKKGSMQITKYKTRLQNLIKDSHHILFAKKVSDIGQISYIVPHS